MTGLAEVLARLAAAQSGRQERAAIYDALVFAHKSEWIPDGQYDRAMACYNVGALLDAALTLVPERPGRRGDEPKHRNARAGRFSICIGGLLRLGSLQSGVAFMTPLDLDEIEDIARRKPADFIPKGGGPTWVGFVLLAPAERDALVAAARVGAGHILTLQMVQEMLTVPAAEYVPAIADALWQIDLALREGGCAAPTLAARGPEMPADVAGTIEWLKELADKGGKGAVGSVDARALGRAATLIEALGQQRREAVVGQNEAIAERDVALTDKQLASARAEQAEEERDEAKERYEDNESDIIRYMTKLDGKTKGLDAANTRLAALEAVVAAQDDALSRILVDCTSADYPDADCRKRCEIIALAALLRPRGAERGGREAHG